MTMQLEARFKKLGLPTGNHKKHSLRKSLQDRQFRKTLIKSFKESGRTMYTIYHADSILKQNPPGNNRIEATFKAAKQLWEKDSEEIKSFFKQKTAEFCQHKQVVLWLPNGEQLLFHGLQEAKKPKSRPVDLPVARLDWSFKERTMALGLPTLDLDIPTLSKAQKEVVGASWLDRNLEKAGRGLFGLLHVAQICSEEGLVGQVKPGRVLTTVNKRFKSLDVPEQAGYEERTSQLRAGGISALFSDLGLLSMPPIDPLRASEPQGSTENRSIKQESEGDHAQVSKGIKAEPAEDDGFAREGQRWTVTRPQPAHMKPKFTQAAVEDLSGDFKVKIARFAALFGDSGQDLFEWHVYPIICEQLGHMGSDSEVEMASSSIWELLPTKHKWSEASRQLREQCRRGEAVALCKLAWSQELKVKGEEDLHQVAVEEIISALAPRA